MAITHVLAYRPGLGTVPLDEFIQQNGTEMTGWDILPAGGTFTFESGTSEVEMTGWDILPAGGTFVIEGGATEEMSGWSVDNNAAGTFAAEPEEQLSGWDIAGPT